jgi:membrane protease YdiL (CAAX protease family)
MSAMTQSLGGFRAALLAGWFVLGVAGWWLARDKGIPGWAALPVVAAFLVEYPFYLATGFPALRSRMAERLPLFLALSMPLPWLVACVGTGTFQWSALVKLEAVALAIGLWYAILSRSGLADAGFLALTAAVLMGKYFHEVYIPPYPGMETPVLGQLALIRASALTVLAHGRADDAQYGFWPARREWAIGFRHYLYFLPVGFPLGLALGVMRWGPLPPAWRMVATFFGIFWVVALSEELFFRGVMQRRLEKWTGRPAVALCVASLLFGAVHLPFRGFPNWRFALLAAVAGLFYGRAFQEAGSIRASMVAHALVVVTWRALFW